VTLNELPFMVLFEIPFHWHLF